jgi:hypothetical protein
MNPWLILGFVLAVGAAGGVGYLKGDSAGQAAVQQRWDQERAQQAEAHAMAMEAARQKEQELQSKADQIRKDKDREIRDVNARATALANSLRVRPERPAPDASPVPGTASTGPAPAGCSGPELFRQDAELLVREAERGDQLRAALKQCYAQYESLKTP